MRTESRGFLASMPEKENLPYISNLPRVSIGASKFQSTLGLGRGLTVGSQTQQGSLKSQFSSPQGSTRSLRWGEERVGTCPSLLHHMDPILRHLLQREASGGPRNPDFLSGQGEVSARMRSILFDWLVDVCVKFRLLAHTLFSATELIDFFLSIRPVSRQRLQLLGVAALFITGKIEEIYPPVLKDYVAVCDHAYTPEDILAMEGEILVSRGFSLAPTTSLVFLEHFRTRLPLSDRAFAFAHYLLEAALLDAESLRFANSVLAAGSLLLVSKIFKKSGWTSAHEAVTGVKEPKAKACAKELFAVMGRMERSSLTAVRRKFADPALFEVSNFTIEKVNPPGSLI